MPWDLSLVKSKPNKIQRHFPLRSFSLLIEIPRFCFPRGNLVSAEINRSFLYWINTVTIFSMHSKLTSILTHSQPVPLSPGKVCTAMNWVSAPQRVMEAKYVQRWTGFQQPRGWRRQSMYSHELGFSTPEGDGGKVCTAMNWVSAPQRVTDTVQSLTLCLLR